MGPTVAVVVEEVGYAEGSWGDSFDNVVVVVAGVVDGILVMVVVGMVDPLGNFPGGN